MKTALQIGIETLVEIQDPAKWQTGSLGYDGGEARCLVGHVAYAGGVVDPDNDDRLLYPDELEGEFDLALFDSLSPTLQFMETLRNTPQISEWFAAQTGYGTGADTTATNICWNYNDAVQDHPTIVAAVAHAVAYLAKEVAEGPRF